MQLARKKRGRPPKAKSHFVAITDFSLARIQQLSSRIAEDLGVDRGALTDQLAEVAANYELMADVRKNAPLLVKRKGNRPKIHLAWLLVDCARVFGEQSGKSAESELRKLGGWEEQRDAPASEVKAYALSVLASLGITHPQSLRQQARQALKQF